MIAKVRPLWRRDLSDIKKIMIEGNVFSKDDARRLHRMMSDYLEYPQKDELRTFVCSFDGRVAGFISIGMELGEGTWEIYVISVSPEFQGIGIGKMLMKRAESHIRSRSARMIIISTSSLKDYLPARRLYKSMGYMQVSKIRDFFNDGDHRIFLTKRLKKKAACSIGNVALA